MALGLDTRRVTDARVPWLIAVSFLIRSLDESSTLPEVYAIAEPLRRSFPGNHNVEAKIRQSLQILRDRGRVAFEGSGRYRKLLADVRPRVHLDFGEAARYTSRSQIARNRSLNARGRGRRRVHSSPWHPIRVRVIAMSHGAILRCDELSVRDDVRRHREVNGSSRSQDHHHRLDPPLQRNPEPIHVLDTSRLPRGENNRVSK